MSIPVTVNYSIWVRPLRKTMAVLLLALTVSGCSFALVQGPPEGHESMAYFSPAPTTANGPHTISYRREWQVW